MGAPLLVLGAVDALVLGAAVTLVLGAVDALVQEADGGIEEVEALEGDRLDDDEFDHGKIEGMNVSRLVMSDVFPISSPQER